MRRIVPILTVALLIGAQLTGRAQTVHRLFFNYSGMSFGGKAVSGSGPVTGGSRITVSLTLDVPDLRVNITTHDRSGRQMTQFRGKEPLVTSPSNVSVNVVGWKMSDGVHNASEQNAILDIRSFVADVMPNGIIRSISWDISARYFEPGAQLSNAAGRQSFSIHTASGQNDESTSNYPNGDNSAQQSGARLGSGTWRVTMTPSNKQGASAWNPNAPSNTDMPTGSGQFRTIPNGSRFVFKGTKVFIQDAAGNLTVAPDGKYHPFNNSYIMVVRGGEKFTSNN
jgi:hypothetical protein